MLKVERDAPYSPGEWLYGWDYDEDEGHCILCEDGGCLKCIAVCLERDLFGGVEFSSEEVEANAHLISAAPDMYEALRAVLDSDMAQREEDDGVQSDILNRVRVVLKKARTGIC